ncbi:hypothetical protein RchiOBHm_Chr5g0030931 [Rosa chinensis]|uniref:Uncharacterized protein n=1 Tax=Rosa chinensis TaxID=74649 RepID=A0A2P6QA14_ROSCH|nr:hypothetical protein RchiOBHm_Chr5g0030931 [Rosa chinensis]
MGLFSIARQTSHSASPPPPPPPPSPSSSSVFGLSDRLLPQLVATSFNSWIVAAFLYAFFFSLSWIVAAFLCAIFFRSSWILAGPSPAPSSSARRW